MAKKNLLDAEETVAEEEIFSEEEPAQEEEPAHNLVRMFRNEGYPNTADVHQAEVDNFKAGGWEIAE